MFENKAHKASTKSIILFILCTDLHTSQKTNFKIQTSETDCINKYTSIYVTILYISKSGTVSRTLALLAAKWVKVPSCCSCQLCYPLGSCLCLRCFITRIAFERFNIWNLLFIITVFFFRFNDERINKILVCFLILRDISEVIFAPLLHWKPLNKTSSG